MSSILAMGCQACQMTGMCEVMSWVVGLFTVMSHSYSRNNSQFSVILIGGLIWCHLKLRSDEPLTGCKEINSLVFLLFLNNKKKSTVDGSISFLSVLNSIPDNNFFTQMQRSHRTYFLIYFQLVQQYVCKHSCGRRSSAQQASRRDTAFVPAPPCG